MAGLHSGHGLDRFQGHKETAPLQDPEVCADVWVFSGGGVPVSAFCRARFFHGAHFDVSWVGLWLVGVACRSGLTHACMRAEKCITLPVVYLIALLHAVEAPHTAILEYRAGGILIRNARSFPMQACLPVFLLGVQVLLLPRTCGVWPCSLSLSHRRQLSFCSALRLFLLQSRPCFSALSS